MLPQRCADVRYCNRMTPKAFEHRCLRLPAATKVVQWEGTSVFKVGGKMFAISGGFTAGSGGYMFKVSNMAYSMLIEHGLARPAPYLARAKWVQLASNNTLPDAELTAYIAQAHALIVAKLTRKTRKELGLVSPEAGQHDDLRVQRIGHARRH